MHPEMPKSGEERITREELVTYLKARKEETDALVSGLNDKKPEIIESAEGKMMLHNWITERLKLFDRIEVTKELGDICKEAGLSEESERQYANAEQLVAAERIIEEKNKSKTA